MKGYCQGHCQKTFIDRTRLEVYDAGIIIWSFSETSRHRMQVLEIPAAYHPPPAKNSITITIIVIIARIPRQITASVTMDRPLD